MAKAVSVGNKGPVLLASTSAASLTTAPMMLEAFRLHKWNFALSGTFTGYSVAIQGTIDPNTSGYLGGPTPTGTSWFLLSGPSQQGGEGVEANPLTTTTMSLQYDGQLKAVRAVITGTAQTGTVYVYGFAYE